MDLTSKSLTLRISLSFRRLIFGACQRALSTAVRTPPPICSVLRSCSAGKYGVRVKDAKLASVISDFDLRSVPKPKREVFLMRRVLLVILVTVVSAPIAAEEPSLAVAVTETAVEVTNVPPRGVVVLLTCGRVSYQGRTHLARRGMLLRDDDGDGRVRHLPPEGVPFASVWIAVNYSSGEVAVGAHPDFPLSWSPLPVTSLRKDADDQVAFIEHELTRVVLFLIRPDTSVWEILGRDASSTDRDGAPNGKLKLAFEDARIIEGRDKAPKHLKKGDVVVAVNPGHIEVFTTQVDK